MNIPSVEKVLDKLGFLSNVFSKPELKNCFFLIFSVMFSPKKTVASMAEWLENINQSTLNRFLTESPWKIKKFFKQHHIEIKKQVKNKVVKLLIDDSKLRKTGEHIARTGIEFDHCQKKSIRCFSIVFSVVKIAGFQLPIPFAAEECKRKKNKKDKRKKSKITLAMKMIREFVELTKEAAKRIIIFDSWYCGEALIKSIPKGVFWVTRLKFKHKRLVKMNDCWLPVWKFCRRVNSWNFKRVKVNDHYFYAHTEKITIHGLGEVTIVMSKLSRYTRGYQVFISNLDTAKEILENYEERWDIEVFFRTVKQNFGIGAVQMRKYWGNRRYWSIVLLAYSSIAFLQQLWKKTCKTAGETMKKLKKLLQNSAANYGMNFGRYIHFYVCEKFAKL